MIHKDRGNRRKTNYKKAIRKSNIIKDHHNYWSYSSLNELSKEKIHCSCPMCKAKTNNTKNKSRGPVDSSRKGFCRLACTNKRYGRKHWKPSDRRKIDNMNYMINIYLKNNK